MGSFETRDPTEAYHVAVLEDMRCVKAIVRRDKSGRYAYGKILLVRERGYEIMEQLDSDSKNHVPGGNADAICDSASYVPDDEDMKAADGAYKVETEEMRLYETRMHLSDFGGISVVLLICKGYLEVCRPEMISTFNSFIYESKFSIVAFPPAFKFVPFAIAFWGLAEITLVISHILSAKAHNFFQEEIYKGNRASGWKSGWRTATLWSNRIAGAMFVLGVVCAIIFVFKLIG